VRLDQRLPLQFAQGQELREHVDDEGLRRLVAARKERHALVDLTDLVENARQGIGERLLIEDLLQQRRHARYTIRAAR
jgi:hypothetical protein